MKENLKFSSIVILISLFVLLVPVLFMKIFELAFFILGYINALYKHFLIFCGIDSVFADLLAPLFLGFSLLLFSAAIFTFIFGFFDEKKSKKNPEGRRSTSGRILG